MTARTPPLPPDTFGDPFTIDTLPLPRPAAGYAIQKLDTDQLFDRQQQAFLPIRSPNLQPLFASFAEAHSAAANWLHQSATPIDSHTLAIVPVGYDDLLQRHVLIYGVIRTTP